MNHTEYDYDYNATSSNDTSPAYYNYDDYVLDDDGNIICEELTDDERQFYAIFAWWLEGIGQMTVGGIGFLANCLAIPILGSKEMSSMFNRLLICLAVFDNIFIVCSVLECIRKHVTSTQVHEYIFGYFLYQFHNMIVCCCTYVTVVLALERYRAVWRPIEYHNNVNSSPHPWRRVFKSYIVPVVIFSILFNLPKFFETKFKEAVVYEKVHNPETNTTFEVASKVWQLAATDLRLDDNYVLWYSNIARLIVTGIVPLASLAYLNFRIYSVVKRRRRMTNRPSTTSAATAAQKAEETRQAIVLFAIVILFVCCHALRILLNVNELLTLKVVRASIKNGCFGVPFWALIGVAVSHFLITVNSSVNFFIYCFMCTTFRKIFISYLKKVFCGCSFLDHFASSHPSPRNNGHAMGEANSFLAPKHSPQCNGSNANDLLTVEIADNCIIHGANASSVSSGNREAAAAPSEAAAAASTSANEAPQATEAPQAISLKEIEVSKPDEILAADQMDTAV